MTAFEPKGASLLQPDIQPSERAKIADRPNRFENVGVRTSAQRSGIYSTFRQRAETVNHGRRGQYC
jgi:hypothetical protein